MYALLVAVLLTVAVSSAQNVEDKITCERQPMKLECKTGEVLKIITANYGRTNAKLCDPNPNTNCRASGSLSIIRNKCEGKTSCTVMATNDVFGDPCNGVMKYIEAQYQCVPDFETKITCERQPMKLECKKGEVLKIISANYGRTNANLCEPNANTNCHASGSLDIIKNKCEGKTSCIVMATNDIFGDPCYGVVKYIEAQYQCVPEYEKKITCERQPMKLECKNGEVLKIISANYGRTNANVCEPNANTNCRASGSLDIIKNNCEGKTSCTVMATNDVFGDPCHGVVKYIDAQYQCVPGYRTAYACEGDTLNVECARGEVIQFVSGNYGRTNSALCEMNTNTNCRSSVANSILKDKCDLRRGCSVSSSNEVFGDPCYGVKKYIEMNYYCIQIKL